MSDSKIYMFGDERGNNQNGFGSDFLTGALLGGNGGFGGFGGGNWLLALLFFALWGNNGWGGFGNWGGNRGCGNAAGFGFLSDQLNNDAGRELLMQAIQGNSNAISQLASTLNCNVGELRNAINSISTQICNLGNQVGMSTMQVINAINAGNTTLASQLAECWCKTQTAIAESNYLTERGFANTNQILSQGFSSVAYETQRQTCDIEKAIASSTESILAGQRAAEMREMQDKLDALREKNAQQAVILNNAQQTAQFASMIAPIAQDLEKIKCKLPETVTLPYSCATAVPTTAVYGNFGLGYGFNYGCGCQNSLWG